MNSYENVHSTKMEIYGNLKVAFINLLEVGYPTLRHELKVVKGP